MLTNSFRHTNSNNIKLNTLIINCEFNAFAITQKVNEKGALHLKRQLM